MKIMYEFDISKEVEVEKTETREENGAQISVTTKVKENKPIYFAIKRPSRNEKEEAEMYRATHFANCVERGIITQAALRKRYGDTVGIGTNSGVYTNEEEKQYSILRAKLRDDLEEYQFLTVNPEEKNKEKIEKLFEQIFKMSGKIREFENSSTLFYQDTAESKARNKLVEYFILHLTYFKDDKEKDWISFFKGETNEEKIRYLSKLEDEDDELYLKVGEKLAFVITLLLTSPNISKEEIDQLQKEVV